MELINIFGESFTIEAARWTAALEMAREYGWQPAGTRKPPTSLDRGNSAEEWNRAYSPASGQEVSRPDALALGTALEQALNQGDARAESLIPLIEFCFRSGFVLKQGTVSETSSLLSLFSALHPSSAGSSSEKRLSRVSA